MYLLQIRKVFLQDLKAIPLRCNHLEGQDLCLPVAVEGSFSNPPASRQLAGLLRFFTKQPFVILNPCLQSFPIHNSPFKTSSHLCANQNGTQLFSFLLVLTNVQLCLFLKCRYWLCGNTYQTPTHSSPSKGWGGLFSEGEGEAESCQERSWEEIGKM